MYLLGMIRRESTQLSNVEEALPNGMNVSQVHKLNLTVGIVLKTFTAPTTGSIGHSRRVWPRIQNQQFLKVDNRAEAY